MLYLNKYLDKVKPQSDDDVVDRLNYVYSPIILLCFALTTGAKQYVGEPLQCWVPAEYKGNWEKYIENYCFVENTYFVPNYQMNLGSNVERKNAELQYYQWVPFMLAFQALLFYAPRLLWRLANWHSGLRILDVIQRARSTVKEGKSGGKELKEREGKTFEEIGEHFTRRHDFQKAKSTRRHRDEDEDSKLWKRRSHWFSGLWGVYVTALYLFVKLLFLCNTLLQFAMLKRFLGFKDSFWGYEVLFNLINGEKWHTTGHFPRVTNCDVPVLKMSGLQKYTFQCVLSINMINERIFVFLWWWLLALVICSMFNLIYWLYISFMPGSNEDFIKKYLGYNDYKAEPSQVHDFVRNDLELDGMTLLRMIADHCGEEPTAGIVKCLWKVNHPVPQPWLMTASMLYDKSSADSMSNRTSSTMAVNDSNGIEYETKPCKQRK